MKTLTLDFEILYLLESPEIILTEIRRKEIGSSVPSSGKFQWLKIDKATQAISPMISTSCRQSL